MTSEPARQTPRETKPQTTGGSGDIPGQTVISPDVVAAIAGSAASGVEGVVRIGSGNVLRSMADAVGNDSSTRGRGVTVESGRHEAIFDMDLTVLYGYSIPEVVSNVRRAIADELQKQLGLVAKEINITIAAVEFPDELDSRVE